MAFKLHFATQGHIESSDTPQRPDHESCLRLMEVDPHRPETWPFMPGDVTAGAESELQVAVRGLAADVDLPLTIRHSNYFSNVMRRASAGDAPKRIVQKLEKYLEGTPDHIWENSWVRFPADVLSGFAQDQLTHDLQADKTLQNGPFRADADRFFLQQYGQTWLRIPISYLIKLSLAHAISDGPTPELVVRAGKALLPHFLSDNTSPESYSFHVASLHRKNGMGAGLVREIARRHLLTHVLVQYANSAFHLRDHGQEAMVFSSPSPPLRQRYLNDCISDSFYRELFMSPCLSGWDQGEHKHAYMQVCHKTLSRSQLNTVAKLKEAGIIVNNLVVLPNTSSTSLANNGIHISMGSKKLTALRADPDSGFDAAHEKYIGDLVIKIVEHFLPLFVGRYSASPHRFGFADFHPERALGFLPHELDYTHLRMLWRRWKGKAQIRCLSQPVTPFGPEWFDSLFGKLFRLKGDFLPDVRLVDYMVAVLSTENSPALNGMLNNDCRLKNDLHALGVFDRQMSLYQLFKMRNYDAMGYTGFEGRFYSLFPDFQQDLNGATNLQLLLTTLAYKYAIQQTCTHDDIPDTPFIESERRQIFFASAIGIPTFYVRSDTGNTFLKRILAHTRRTRKSRRYPGYTRVYLCEYQRALLKLIKTDAADLIPLMGLEATVSDLTERIDAPEKSAAWSKLSAGMMADSRKSKPMQMRSHSYNELAESYYRETLHRNHMAEAFAMLRDDMRTLKQLGGTLYSEVQQTVYDLLGTRTPRQFLAEIESRFAHNNLTPAEWETLIHLLLLAEHVDAATQDAKANIPPPTSSYQIDFNQALQA